MYCVCSLRACVYIYIYGLHVSSLDLVEPRSTAFDPEQPFPRNFLHVLHLGWHPFVWPPCDCKDSMNPNFFLKWHHAGRSILPRPAATVYRSSTLLQVCSKNAGRCTFYGSFIAPKKVLWKTWMHHVFPGGPLHLCDVVLPAIRIFTGVMLENSMGQNRGSGNASHVLRCFLNHCFLTGGVFQTVLPEATLWAIDSHRYGWEGCFLHSSLSGPAVGLLWCQMLGHDTNLNKHTNKTRNVTLLATCWTLQEFSW